MRCTAHACDRAALQPARFPACLGVMAGLVTDDWATGVLLAVLVQNVVVALAVLALRSGPRVDWRLAALLCVLGLKGAPYFFGWRGHVEAPDWLAFFPLNAPLAIGPLLYGYVLARTEGAARGMKCDISRCP